MTIRSKLIGESNGWGGETVLQLENGQIWHQVEYYYEYQYSYRPIVVITNNNMATIEGISKSIRVEQIK